MPLRHDFKSSAVSASVLAQGAELCMLRDTAGADYLWDAGAAWPRHAPILFPIVGRLAGDQLVHAGRTYPMNQHGFARDTAFDWVSRTDDGCVLALSDTEATRARYPFAFRFEVEYRARGAVLEMMFRVINTGTQPLPCSFGAHPAFRWPLQPGVPKDAYSLTFDKEETGYLRRVIGGLLTEADRDNPVFDRRLALREELFADDALIFPEVASRTIRFAADGEKGLAVSWDGFPQLGIWSRAGGDFVCIEPWCGMASPAGFTGEFADKPWIVSVPVGGVRAAAVRMEVAI
jgi:galactose mutarotase-like enzyme